MRTLLTNMRNSDNLIIITIIIIIIAINKNIDGALRLRI